MMTLNHTPAQAAPKVTAPVSTGGPSTVGRRGMAVGHMAKQAVEQARASGADLPRNAQGLAASQIARGADPAGIFAALVATEPVSEASADSSIPPVGPDTGATTEDTAPAVSSDAESVTNTYQQATDLLNAGTGTPADLALDLLS